MRSAPFTFFVHSTAANAALRRRPSAAILFDQWDNNHTSSSWAFAVHHLAASGVPGSREIRGADRAGISGTHGRISGACELPFRGRFAEIRQLDSRLSESEVGCFGKLFTGSRGAGIRALPEHPVGPSGTVVFCPGQEGNPSESGGRPPRRIKTSDESSCFGKTRSKLVGRRKQKQVSAWVI